MPKPKAPEPEPAEDAEAVRARFDRIVRAVLRTPPEKPRKKPARGRKPAK